MVEQEYHCHNCGVKVASSPDLDEGEGILCEPCWVEKEHIERLIEVKTALQNITTIIQQWEYERGLDGDDEEIFNSLLINAGSELPEALAGFTGFMLLNKELLLNNTGEEIEENYGL